MKTEQIVSRVALTCILGEVLLILLSWLLSAMGADGVRPLLSAEGTRWFFTNFVAFLGKRWLVWLLLLAMAGGCLNGCRVLRPADRKRHRQGLLIASLLLIIYIGVLLLLVATPHAPLLSATGVLWPSPFSRALVPVVAFGLIVASAGYGVATRVFSSFTDVCKSLVQGIAVCAPLFFVYLLLVQFLESVHYAFF